MFLRFNKRLMKILWSILLLKKVVECIEDNFLWGAATAAYQIEGAVKEDGRGRSIWDSFSEIPKKISHGQTGEIADDSYHLYEQDIALLKQLGVNAYRFSISWSRILPEGTGEVNPAGIAHYNHLINRLIEEKIEPLVTLYHWDLPDALEQKETGLVNPNFENYFVEFANICFEQFGDRVKRWITINEPWTVAFMGYGAGLFAPGRCSDRSRCQQGDSARETYIVGHNLLNAHAAAVDLYRKKYQLTQRGVIGITLNQDWAEPLTQDPHDIAAAERRIEFQLGWFTDPIYFGDYPASMKAFVGDRLPAFTEAQKERLLGSIDFLGLNHYSTKFYFYRDKALIANYPEILNHVNITSTEDSMKYGGWADDQLNYETKYDVQGDIIGLQAQSPWLNVVPWGFYKVIMWVHNRYKNSALNKVPIIITENGCDAPQETEKPLLEAIHDEFRVKYFEQYLSAMQKAIQDGANVKGYFAWSLLDNFEWADGYDMRFGLFYVDYNDPKRTRYTKDSAIWYHNYITKQQRIGRKTWKDILYDAIRNRIELILEKSSSSTFLYQ